MRQTTQNEVHPYDVKIRNLLKKCKMELSENNYDLIIRYDVVMIQDTLSLATRNKHLEIVRACPDSSGRIRMKSPKTMLTGWYMI